MGLSRSRQALLEISSCLDKSNLLHQIFLFIGSKPEEAVSHQHTLSLSIFSLSSLSLSLSLSLYHKHSVS